MNSNLQIEQQVLSLDFNQKIYKTIIVKQYDCGSRFVPIKCTNNGPFFPLNDNFTVQIKILTPDDRALLENVPIQSDGSLLLELKESMLCYPGRANAEIIIYDTQKKKRLSTMNFYLLIESSVYDDDRIVSSDEFNALVELLEKANADYTYVINEASKSAQNAKDSEIAAKVSEENSKASELAAKESETEAKVSEENALKSELHSKTSETNAKVSEDNAFLL